MIRLVPDTNVLIRGFTSHRNEQRQLINLALANKVILYGCDETYIEFKEKLKIPRLKRYLVDHLFSVEKLLGDYRVLVNMVRPHDYGIAITRDQDDDIFFGIAKSCEAKIIVSEDKDILTTKRHDEIRAVSTAQFLASYKKASKGGSLY